MWHDPNTIPGLVILFGVITGTLALALIVVVFFTTGAIAASVCCIPAAFAFNGRANAIYRK